MADSNNADPFDDLEAFFSAAADPDPKAVERAAENIVQGSRPRAGNTSRAAANTPAGNASRQMSEVNHTETDAEDTSEKFIAIDPDLLPGSAKSDPFVLVPAHIHTLIPWWVWVSIAVCLIMMIAGIVLLPSVTLDRLTARLGDDDPSNTHSVMRQLVISGDEKTIARLHELAATPQNPLAMRLRAVDTLGLINRPGADRALLRLELASGTDAEVREAAIAARKQREAAKTRSRQP